jgi:multiple antibiotic resistance protein
MKNILLAFVPIFFAVDAIGVLPIFIALTHGLRKKEKARILLQSMVTTLALAMGFIFLGKGIFRFLGITIGDFMIAGGSILFCIAILDILQPGRKHNTSLKELGAVPLGTPLIVGPAVLTTCLVMIGEYGTYPTLIAVFLNVLLAGTIFGLSGYLILVLGEAGSKALSKITSLFLAAIAVMLVRKGLVFYLVR